MQETQAVFETVVRHLFAQGKQAMVRGSCKYRTSDGLMCAMGVLIPADLYNLDMEGMTASMMFEAYDQLGEQYDSQQKHLITDLQWAHDEETNWNSSESLTNALIEVGIQHGLSVEFIDGLYFGMNK